MARLQVYGVRDCIERLPREIVQYKDTAAQQNTHRLLPRYRHAGDSLVHLYFTVKVGTKLRTHLLPASDTN